MRNFASSWVLLSDLAFFFSSPLLGLHMDWCFWLSSPFSGAGVTWEWCWALSRLLAHCQAVELLWMGSGQGHIRGAMSIGKGWGRAQGASKIHTSKLSEGPAAT